MTLSGTVKAVITLLSDGAERLCRMEFVEKFDPSSFHDELLVTSSLNDLRLFEGIIAGHLYLSLSLDRLEKNSQFQVAIREFLQRLKALQVEQETPMVIAEPAPVNLAPIYTAFAVQDGELPELAVLDDMIDSLESNPITTETLNQITFLTTAGVLVALAQDKSTRTELDFELFNLSKC